MTDVIFSANVCVYVTAQIHAKLWTELHTKWIARLCVAVYTIQLILTTICTDGHLSTNQTSAHVGMNLVSFSGRKSRIDNDCAMCVCSGPGPHSEHCPLQSRSPDFIQLLFKASAIKPFALVYAMRCRRLHHRLFPPRPREQARNP